MTKKELVVKFQEALNTNKEENKPKISKKDAEFYIDTLLETIMDSVANENKLQLIGFGTFEKKPVKGKEGVIQVGVRKGETFKTDDSVKAVFKAGKLFDDRVKGL